MGIRKDLFLLEILASRGLAHVEPLRLILVCDLAISARASAEEAWLWQSSPGGHLFIGDDGTMLCLSILASLAHILQALADYCLTVYLRAIEAHAAAPILPLPLPRLPPSVCDNLDWLGQLLVDGAILLDVGVWAARRLRLCTSHAEDTPGPLLPRHLTRLPLHPAQPRMDFPSVRTPTIPLPELVAVAAAVRAAWPAVAVALHCVEV